MSSENFDESVTPATERSLWGALRLAIAGTERDFTRLQHGDHGAGGTPDR